MQQQLVKARYESLHKKIANKIFVKKVITATLHFPEKYKTQELLRDLFFLKLEGCLKGYFLLLGDNIPSESTMVERTGLNLKSIIKTEGKGREFKNKTLSTIRQVGNIWNAGEVEVEVEVVRNQEIQNNNFRKKNIKKNEKGNEDRDIEKKKVKERGDEREQQAVKEKEKRKRQKIEEINQKEEKYWNMTSTRFNSLRR